MFSRFPRSETLSVSLDYVPCWSDPDYFSQLLPVSTKSILDKFDNASGPLGSTPNHVKVPKFCADSEINSRLFLWRGPPWPLQVDAVVNSTNENLDEVASSPGLHAAAGPELAEECNFLGTCRTGEAKITDAGELPARKVIHTVGPRYNPRYHTAAENALSHAYRSCLELLVENGLFSIAMGCIYSESKNFPRELAAHIAIRTVRRFLEKHKHKISAVVLCTISAVDTEIYKRLLPLYFPRNAEEENEAFYKLPTEVGDENGETVIKERNIRINQFPKLYTSTSLHSSNSISNANNTDANNADANPNASSFDYCVIPRRPQDNREEDKLDPDFISMMKDPDVRREEEWQKLSKSSQADMFGFPFLNFCGLNSPSLSAELEECLHARYVAKAALKDLSEISEMKIIYKEGSDVEGRQVVTIVGAHFLPRSMDTDSFILHAVKEFEAIVHRPFCIVYFHSATSIPLQPDFGFVKRLLQILGQRFRHNLQAIHVVHASIGLRLAILCLKLFVFPEVWNKVHYQDRLIDLFKNISRDQLTIPDFIYQNDLEMIR